MPAERLSRRTPPVPVGIVHLGPGAFFRAFNAIYTAEAMAASGGDWGIAAVSLRRPNARDELAPQGGAFTAVTLDPDGQHHAVIESITELFVASEDVGAVLARMADPAVRIVSLTVTEKGYCHQPATGRLLTDHPDVLHDLAQPQTPRSVPGLITAALARRRRAGVVPFTVLSCDNLPANGPLTRAIVVEFARQRDAALADWIEAEVAFPATMVDRITPATTAADIDRLEASAGWRDPGLVIHEPFRQWVIEERFAAGRPAWDAVGAEMVEAIGPYQQLKLRLLNGPHSALAYLGQLLDLATVADAMADADLRPFVEHLMRREIAPTLELAGRYPVDRYIDALLERFANTAIRHKTEQIAMDGSQKLPVRWLGTLRDRLAGGEVPAGLSFCLAAWIAYLRGGSGSGRALSLNDPAASVLQARAQGEDAARAVLEYRPVFGDLGQRADLAAAVAAHLVRLDAEGPRSALQSVAANL